MSCVVYAPVLFDLDKGPPRRVICARCQETTASCRCHDEWFALAERVRVAEESDGAAVSRG